MYENFSDVIEEVVDLFKELSKDHEVDEYSHQCFLECKACRANFLITVFMQKLKELNEEYRDIADKNSRLYRDTVFILQVIDKLLEEIVNE